MRYPIKNIFTCLLISFMSVISSCSDQPFMPTQDSQRQTTSFDIDIPAHMMTNTRAGSKNKINTVWMLVFDENGYFREKVKAVSVSEDGMSYKANITSYSHKCVIHFVAGYDMTDKTFPYTTEDVIMSSLPSTDKLCYWQRRVYDGTDELKNATISLVRNQAQIAVKLKETVSEEGWELCGFDVLNNLDRGTLAPYNVSYVDYQNRNNLFAVYNENTNYKTLTNSGFTGYAADDAVLVNSFDSLDKNMTELREERKDKTTPFDIFESPFNKKNHIIVLICLKKNNKKYYYSVDLVYDKEISEGVKIKEYYNILRNFKYNIEITNVKEGFATPYEAAETIACNNLSASIWMDDLTSICSDEDGSLKVEYVKKTFSTSRPLEFKFRYRDKSGECKNNEVKFIAEDGDLFKKASFDNINESMSEILHDKSDISEVVIPLDIEPGAKIRKQDIYVVAGKLYKKIRFVYHNTYSYEGIKVNGVSLDGSNDKALVDIYMIPNERIDLSVLLPGGLSKNMFPLKFYIESDKKDIAQDDKNIKLEYGLSILPDNHNQSCHYLKTVEYEEFMNLPEDENGARWIGCGLKYAPMYADVEDSNIYIYNDYFGIDSIRIGKKMVTKSVTMSDNVVTIDGHNALKDDNDHICKTKKKYITFPELEPYVFLTNRMGLYFYMSVYFNSGVSCLSIPQESEKYVEFVTKKDNCYIYAITIRNEEIYKRFTGTHKLHVLDINYENNDGAEIYEQFKISNKYIQTFSSHFNSVGRLEHIVVEPYKNDSGKITVRPKKDNKGNYIYKSVKFRYPDYEWFFDWNYGNKVVNKIKSSNERYINGIQINGNDIYGICYTPNVGFEFFDKENNRMKGYITFTGEEVETTSDLWWHSWSETPWGILAAEWVYKFENFNKAALLGKETLRCKPILLQGVDPRTNEKTKITISYE